VKISKKSQKNTESFKNDSTLYPPGTTLSKIKSFKKRKKECPTYRLLVTIDGILFENGLYVVGTDLSLENFFAEVLMFFQQKYPSKILYALNEMEFSSFHELRSILNLQNMVMIRKVIFRLEEIGLITELSKDMESDKIIRAYWKKEYITAPEFTKLFKLLPEFRNAVELYKDRIIKKYMTPREYSMIENRKRRYNQYKSVVEKQLKNLKNAVSKAKGKCVACKGIIRGDAIKGLDFHSYQIGYVCNQCNKRASNQQIVKWMRHKE